MFFEHFMQYVLNIFIPPPISSQILPLYPPDLIPPLSLYHCPDWIREAPSSSGKFTVGQPEKTKGHEMLSCEWDVGITSLLRKIVLKRNITSLTYRWYWRRHSQFQPRLEMDMVPLPVTSWGPVESVLEEIAQTVQGSSRAVVRATGYYLQVVLDVVFRKIYF